MNSFLCIPVPKYNIQMWSLHERLHPMQIKWEIDSHEETQVTDHRQLILIFQLYNTCLQFFLKYCWLLLRNDNIIIQADIYLVCTDRNKMLCRKIIVKDIYDMTKPFGSIFSAISLAMSAARAICALAYGTKKKHETRHMKLFMRKFCENDQRFLATVLLVAWI